MIGISVSYEKSLESHITPFFAKTGKTGTKQAVM
jgi:hypothetical protein